MADTSRRLALRLAIVWHRRSHLRGALEKVYALMRCLGTGSFLRETSFKKGSGYGNFACMVTRQQHVEISRTEIANDELDERSLRSKRHRHPLPENWRVQAPG